MYLCVICLHVHISTPWKSCLWESKVRFMSPKTKYAGSCKLPERFWGISPASFARTASILRQWAISPAPSIHLRISFDICKVNCCNCNHLISTRTVWGEFKSWCWLFQSIRADVQLVNSLTNFKSEFYILNLYIFVRIYAHVFFILLVMGF